MKATEEASRTGPWNSPPTRKQRLREKRAAKQARKAEHWGGLLREAAEIGPEEVAAVTWDRVRASLNKLPERDRARAWEALIQAVDRVRETHAQ